MNKIILLLFASIIFAPAILSLGVKVIPGNIQPPLLGTQKVDNDTTVSQSFKASEDGLSGLGLSIKNPMFVNKKDLTLSLFSEGNLLRQVKLNGAAISDGNFTKIIFEPVNNSAGKNYEATLSAPDVGYKEALEVFLTNKMSEGQASVNGILREDSLSYVTFYSPSNRFELLANIYGNWFNKLITDLPFFIFYITVLSLGVWLLVGPPNFYKVIFK